MDNSDENIIQKSKTGGKINPEKVEPQEMGTYLVSKKKGLAKSTLLKEKDIAQKSCGLDPVFPSPLMTKTLALVSGIARADFNLLESKELNTLKDQLEHLLLVDIPEEEIPEKTRLSFAAGRLSKIIECQLANPEILTSHRNHLARLVDRIKKCGDDNCTDIKVTAEVVEGAIEEEKERLTREVSKAFQLLCKVLKERPDRTRLWTRSVLMCRTTGVKNGLLEIYKIINSNDNNPLTKEFLLATFFSLIGSQVLYAAFTLSDEMSPLWKKEAAKSFCNEIGKLNFDISTLNLERWYMRTAWYQYCFGTYCANLVLNKQNENVDLKYHFKFPEYITKKGQQCINNGILYSPIGWVWWATRKNLSKMESRANYLDKILASQIDNIAETATFWRFFPKDTPEKVLNIMDTKGGFLKKGWQEGWWFDALLGRNEIETANIKAPNKVLRVLRKRAKQTISIYEWSEFLKIQEQKQLPDPRISEWTALEIIRQISILIEQKPEFGPQYIKSAQKGEYYYPAVHPANFKIPKRWMDINVPTWHDWFHEVRGSEGKIKLSFQRKEDRIKDYRYTPLSSQSLLFSVNPIRGVGLILYGLLMKNHELPAVWNGPGHTDVLSMLPKMLLNEMTCSSWTLGVLQGCLQPRTTENLFIKITKRPDPLHPDTLKDPKDFQNVTEIISAIEICQTVLEKYQISTLDHNARQLIPVSIKQLTEPDWKYTFSGELSHD